MGTDSNKMKLESSTSWLLSAGGDKDESVRFAIVTSLCKISKVNPENVLNSVSTFYLIKDPKQLSPSHRLTLLRVAEAVCKENTDQIDAKVARNLVAMALHEMIRSPDFSFETQFLASDLLVALGSKSFCMEVMDAIMGKLEPGSAPHPSLLHCLSALATANAFGMVPFIRGTLGTLLPCCSSLSGEQSKRLFCHLIRSFAEAIEEYMSNMDRAPDPSVTRDAFSTEMIAAYDELSSGWIHSRDPLICRATLEAIGPVLPLLPKEKAVDQLPILAAVLLALYRQKQHHSDPLAITHCLCHMLEVASNLPAGALPDPLPEQLLKAAFDQVSVSPDISTPLLMKNHYEALRCIQVLAGSRWNDHVWEQVIYKLKGVHSSSGIGGISHADHIINERIRALWVLVHLLSSPEKQKSSSVETNVVSPGAWISHLVPILQGILSQSDVKMKKVLIRVIVALLIKEYVTGADSRPFIEFIIVHCSNQNATSASPSLSSVRSTNGDEQSLSELGCMCSHSLNLLASTVPQLKSVLRPLLINILIYPPPLHSPASSPVQENDPHQFCPHPASPAILRCLSLLISNNVTEGKEEDSKEQKENAIDDGAKENIVNLKDIIEDPPSLPEALAVLARCLTLLAHPFYPSVSCALGVNTLIFLKYYANNLHPTLPSLYNEKIPGLIQNLKGGVGEFDIIEWFHQIVGLLDSSLALVGDAEWIKGVGKALTSLLLDSAASTLPNFHHHLPVTFLCPKQRSLVYSLLGAVGVWCSDQEFLSSRIVETLLSSPYDVTSPAEAEACAAALGRVAKRHPKLVLQALSVKSKEFGHSGNVLSGLSSASVGGFGGGIMAAKHFIQRLPFGKASQQANEEARKRKEAGFQRATVTLLLCYGRASIAISGDPVALGSFLDPKNSQEVGAISWILQHLDSSKGLDVRLAALATLRQISSAVLALQPSSSAYSVDCSNQNSLARNGNSPLTPALVQAMRQTVLDQIGGEITLLAPSIQTLNMLSKLNPPLSSEERITILKVCFDTVFLLALTTEGLELAKQEHGVEKTHVSRVRGGSAFLGEYDDEVSDNTLDDGNEQEETNWKSDENAGSEKIIYFGVVEALHQLKNFVQSILSEKTCAGTLGEIFTLLEAWIAGSKSANKGEASPYTQFGVQRMAAMLTLSSALTSYLKHFKLSFQVPSKFTECGWMAGVILPRCSDSYLPVRPIAVSCLRLLLLIVARYDEGLPGESILEPETELNGNSSIADLETDMQDSENQLTALAKDVTSQDPEQLFHAIAELAKVTCNNLRNTYILSLVEALLDRGLGDGNSTSSAGASVALNSVLKAKGGYLPNHVPHILDMMLGQVCLKTCPPQTRMGAIRAVLVLATHHPKATVSALLLQALPFDECVVDCWKMLAQDSSLSSEVMQNLLSVIEGSPPYEAQDGDNERRKRKDDRDSIRVANLAPLSAISAMQEMFHCASMQTVALQLFPELFSALLMAMGCYVGTSPPVYMAHRPTPAPITAPRSSNAPLNQKESSGSRFSFVPNRKAYKLNPARVAQGALQAFLLCCDCDKAAETLLKCSNIDAGENLSSFIEMMPYLTRSLCQQTPNQISRVATRLNHYAASTSANEAQLVTVTAFYAELINLGGNGSEALVEVALEHLLTLEAGESPSSSPSASVSSATSSPENKPSQWSTPTPLLRILCLRGLANSASLINSQQKGRRITSILRTLIRSVGEGTLKDKAVGSVALEAMRGLSNLLPVIPEETVREVGVTVALHVKPYLDKENSSSLRAASIRLLGNLAKYGSKREHKPSSPTMSPVETDDSVITLANWNAFEEQVKSNLVCLLLRLADSDEDVVKSCKFALREMTYVMDIHWNAKKVSLMIQQHLIDNALLHYERFVTDLVKLMVEEFPEDPLSMLVSSATSYLHSSSAPIRGNAALLLGQLFGSMEEKKREASGENEALSASDLIPLESLSARLSQLLLSDPDAGVRAKAAKAIARLFE